MQNLLHVPPWPMISIYHKYVPLFTLTISEYICIWQLLGDAWDSDSLFWLTLHFGSYKNGKFSGTRSDKLWTYSQWMFLSFKTHLCLDLQKIKSNILPMIICRSGPRSGYELDISQDFLIAQHIQTKVQLCPLIKNDP